MTTAAGRRALPLLFAAALLLVAAGVTVKLTGLDWAWMLRVHAHASGPLAAAFWSCATVAGLGWTALILVLAADRGTGRGTALLLPTFVLGGLLAHIPKALLGSPRPAGTAILPHLNIIGDTFRGSVSMPSGHSVTAAAMGILLCLALPPSRRLIGGAFVLLACSAVAWSRAVVGAHWPADVLVGSGLGLLASALAIAGSRWSRTQPYFDRFAAAVRTRRGQRCVAVLEILAVVGLLKERTGYPAGQPMVILLALVAVLSALWRWHASREARAGGRPGDAAEPT